MKVEDLNLLLQERTPNTLTVEVPMEDGSVRRTMYMRNVISRHAFDSVELTYYPPNTPQNARESVEVKADIHIDDLPIDLSAVLNRLKEQARNSLQPKGPPRRVPVTPFSGGVGAGGAYYDGTSAGAQMNVIGEVSNVMNVGAEDRPAGYVAPDLSSSYHPGQVVPPKHP